MNFTSSKNATEIDKYDVPAAAKCWQLKITAGYIVCLFVTSVVANVLLLWVLLRRKEMRTPVNSFIIFFTILSLFGTCSEFPLIVISMLKCRYNWGKLGCIYEGFTMYSIGCCQTFIATAISIERYIIILKPLSLKKITFTKCYLIIGFCIFLTLIITVSPLLGWSYYSLEGALISCSVEWAERSTSVLSYNIFIFITSWLIPCAIIIPTSIKLLSIVKNAPAIHSDANMSKEEKAENKRNKKERQLTVVMLLYIVGFIVAWTPYACITFYAAFIGKVTTPLLGTIPALIAKSSFVWSTIVFIYSSENTKKIIKSLFFKETEEGVTTNDVQPPKSMSHLRPRTTSAASNASSQ